MGVSFSPAFRRGGVPEWLKGADCKSAGVRLRWFESNPLHQPDYLNVSRTCATTGAYGIERNRFCCAYWIRFQFHGKEIRRSALTAASSTVSDTSQISRPNPFAFDHATGSAGTGKHHYKRRVGNGGGGYRPIRAFQYAHDRGSMMPGGALSSASLRSSEER